MTNPDCKENCKSYFKGFKIAFFEHRLGVEFVE